MHRLVRSPIVLLVEDNPDDVFFLQRSMEQKLPKGALHVVRDGEAALRFLRKEGDFADAPTPQLILLDLKLPRISGLEVLKTLKADAKLRAIPVVVLTSSQEEADVMASYDLSATSVVIKPDDLDAYAATIGALERFWLGLVKLPVR